MVKPPSWMNLTSTLLLGECPPKADTLQPVHRLTVSLSSGRRPPLSYSVRIFQNESFFTAFPSRNTQRSQPLTSIRCPVVVVPDRVHSDAPRSPSTKCSSS